MYESGNGGSEDGSLFTVPADRADHQALASTSSGLPESWLAAGEEVGRERLGVALDLDARVDAVHLGALESFTSLAHEGGGDLSDEEVLELIAAWSRQVAVAESRLREWAAVLSRRPSMSPTWTYPDGRPLEEAADELRFRLGITRYRAQRLIDDGRALTGTLWQVQEALERGWIDAAKATIFVTELAHQPVEVAVAVCDEVLPIAGDLPHEALRKRIQRVLVQIDPGGSDERYEQAVKGRRVNKVRPVGNGMASFSAILPAPDAIALAQAWEATARAARASGDDRTLEQLSADALAAMGASTLSAGELKLPEGLIRFSGRSAHVIVLATAAVLRGEQPPVSAVDVAHHDLYGPSPQDLNDHAYLTQQLNNHPATSASSPRALDASAGSSAGVNASGSSSDADLCCDGFCVHDDFADVSAPLMSSDPGDDPYIDWEPHLHSRPGIDAPELLGYGAIPPALARALTNGPAWLRVEEPIDPADTPPPPTTSYHPSGALDDWVRRRDQTCTAPGCDVPATASDLDHAISYPQGQTDAANLGALCRHDHLLKTWGQYTLTRHPDGSLTWQTRLGQIIHTDPLGRITRQGLGAPTTPLITPRPGAIPTTPEQLEQEIADHDAAEHSPWPGGLHPEDPTNDWNTYDTWQNNRTDHLAHQLGLNTDH